MLSKINTSLKAKLIFIVAILTTVSVSVVGIMSFTKSFSAIQENTISATTQLADQVNQSIILTFDIAEKFLKIGQHEATIEFLNLDKNSEIHKYESAKEVNKVFKLYKGTFEKDQWIKGVYIIGLDGKNICDRQGVYRLPKDLDSISTVNTILSSPRENHIILNQRVDYSREEKYGDVVSLGTGILRPVTRELLGVIIVDIDKSVIEDLCRDIRIGGNGYFSLISMGEEPTCIFSSDPYFNHSEINTKNVDMINNDDSGYFIEKAQGVKYFYIFNTLRNTGWKIIGKVKLGDLMQSAYSIRNITIIAILISIAFTIIVYFFISDKLTLPIVNLKNKMKQAERGNLDVKAECNNKDEIADLCNSFNLMLENLRRLIEKNRREQEMLKKSELRLLQAQINPHFLYNTLDAIVWLSEARDSAHVIDITKALSGFYRIALSSGKEWITIEEEIEHIRSYLIIQGMRYKDILDYKIDIVHEDILDCKILKLILQPIVENALYHGVKSKGGPGLITIRLSKASPNEILVEVIDNGAGMTKERLKAVVDTINIDTISSSKGKGYGLKNVNLRIKLYYGHQYGLDIKSEPDKGTHVSMLLPKTR